MSTTYTTLDKRAANINKSETREKGSKKFTEYIIDIVVENGEEYSIARRFSEFHSLYQLMVYNFQIKFTFPPKKLNKLNSNLVEGRKKALQEFLNFLINSPTQAIRRSGDLSRFLDPLNPVFTNKLVNKKVTLEDVSKKKITLEMTIAEGKDIKMGNKSMWDIVSYCVFDVDKQPEENSNSFINTQYKSNTIPGPYPQWNYKQSVNIKDKKVINFKVCSSTDEVGLIGQASIDITKLSLNNHTPCTLSLPLEPKGSGEILLSLILI